MSEEKVPTSSKDELQVSVYQAPSTTASKTDTSTSDLILCFKTPKYPQGGASSITKPDERFPIDFVATIDISGSMNGDAPTQDTTGVVESTGLNILQVVCQAVKTIASMLSPNDRLSIVTFSTKASVGVPLTKMDDEGQKKVFNYLDALRPTGRTNLFDGIQTSIEELLQHQQGNRLMHCAVLTDGRPTTENSLTPEAYPAALKDLIRQKFQAGNRPMTMSTYGFGYNLNSRLLDDLAEIMNGTFSFIPDSGLIGSVFVNAISSVLSTAARGIMIENAAGADPDDHDNKSATAAVGPMYHSDLQFGGEHISWISMNNSNKNNNNKTPFSIKITYATPSQKEVTITVPVQEAKAIPADTLTKYTVRKNFVDFVRNVARSAMPSNHTTFANEAKNLLKQLEETRKESGAGASSSSSSSSASALTQALEDDLRDQVLLALGNKDYLSRWGNHYAFSLARANEMRICNNFKDKSVQLYATKVFELAREAGEAAFLQIPAPTPYRTNNNTNDRIKFGYRDIPMNVRRQAPAAPVSMGTYYNRGGGCVLGSCQVLMEDGKTHKNAEDVRSGDVLSNGSVVEVAFRINKKDSPSDNIDKKISLVFFESGLVISEYHPIRAQEGNGKCVFPVDVKENVQKIEETDVDYLYTFMLRSSENENKFVNINGIDVLSWGHGIKNDPVARHDFFGSREKIMECVNEKKMNTSSSGVVDVAGFVRDEETNRIVAMF